MTDIANIKKLLNSSNEERRLKGLADLKGLCDDSAVNLLIESLGDESWRVRKIAVEFLSEFKDKKSILPFLIESLRSEDNAGLRNSAVEVLETIGTEAVDTLLPYIDDSDHDLRKQIVDILGNIGDKNVVPYLIQALSDPDENVKSAAAENLGKIGDDEAVNSLMAALKKDDLLLQFSALEALCRIGRAVPIEEIKPLLDNPLLRKASLEVLGMAKDIEALPLLIDGVKTRSKSTKEAALVSIVQLLESIDERDNALSVLCKGRSVLPGFISPCLESDNTSVAHSALKLMGWLQSEEFIPAMLKLALNDEAAPLVMDAIVNIGLTAQNQLIASYSSCPHEIQPLICHLLGEIGSLAAVDLLISELNSDIGHVRHSSATSLGKIGDARAIKPVVPLLKDDYVDVQSAAVQAMSALALVDRDMVVAVIREGLISKSQVFRRNCLKVQASMGEDAEIDIALTALRDEDAVVRRNAVDSLGAIGGKEAIRHIILLLSDEDKEVRIAAAGQLGKLKSADGFQPLSALLEDEDIWVRVAAIKGIAEIDAEKSAGYIADLLDDDVGLTVITSLEVLGRLKLAAYAPLMMRKLKSADSEIVKAAIDGLSFFDDAAYLSELADMLSSENWEIRLSAVRVLAAKGRKDLLHQMRDAEDNDLVKKELEAAFECAGIE
ncbi:MAG: HEAT repeat domain-containing protein [bacterium]|nr:HEAT repeat domain-containing protein [bacterium]